MSRGFFHRSLPCLLCAGALCCALSAIAKPPPAPGSRAPVTLTARQRKNAGRLYQAICQRLATCRPDVVQKSQCRGKLPTDDPFIQTLSPGALDADPKAVTHCVQAVAAAPCEQFFGNEPPPGCEFFLPSPAGNN